METQHIIAEIDKQIAAYESARDILRNASGVGTVVLRTRAAHHEKHKRMISVAGRARIAAAQRARWAKIKRGKKAAKKSTVAAAA